MAPMCPACHGRGMLLGGLGSLTWFRCESCGIDFNLKEAPAEEPEEVEYA